MPASTKVPQHMKPPYPSKDQHGNYGNLIDKYNDKYKARFTMGQSAQGDRETIGRPGMWSQSRALRSDLEDDLNISGE